MKKNNKNKKEFIQDRKEYIDFLANKTNEISMSNNNSKTGKACLNIAFPVVTCRPDAPCVKTCYACKGCQQIAVVQGAYYRNLRLYNDDPDNFFEQVYYKVKFSGLPKVRLFDSGDFPDAEFLVRLADLCRSTPHTKYMAFTKKYELVNEYIDANGKLPDNLNIIFSAWDKLWDVPNPHGLGVAYVDFDDKRLNPDIPENAFRCPGRETTCSACGACWSKKLKAVVFKQH
jgi:hypothetical protein